MFLWVLTGLGLIIGVEKAFSESPSRWQQTNQETFNAAVIEPDLATIKVHTS